MKPEAPINLAEERRARAEVREGGPLPTGAEIIIARAMREGFAGPYDDPEDDPEAA